MSKKIIQAPEGKAPQAIGPYSQGVRVGDLVFLSGQIPTDPATGAFPEGIAAQTEQAIKNITALLAVEGLTLAHVVKASVFMADLAEFAAMNEVYARHFASAPPARSTFQVAKLPRDARVEIEVVAHAGA
ncbi:MAG: Rid family detoxifying hydrolase [Verrucomicrobium sp.]|nr:Rid family detoxifying hydrolase [Verrucomicrobium sp.]